MKILTEHVAQICEAKCADDLLPVVQKVIELEHATIPPYLCGYFSIEQGSNALAAEIIRSVVVEEMLHFTIACNLMNALGGSPSIDSPDFVPIYPDQLPFGIGKHFKVHLGKCSVAQVRDVFMRIEEPEDPIDPDRLRSMLATRTCPTDEDLTIGELYNILSMKLGDLEAEANQNNKTIFVGHEDRQVVPLQWFGANEVWVINNIKTAQDGIALIVDQGEGAKSDPFDEQGNPAHYYRFQQIVEGRMLDEAIKDKAVFSGEPVVLDTDKIFNMDEKPRIAKYKEGSFSRRMATQFSYNYTKLLRSLHDTYNGNPAGIDRSMGSMYELRFSALQALQTPAEYAKGTNTENTMTGLSFEYTPVNA